MNTHALQLWAAKIASLTLIGAWGMWGQPLGYDQPYRPQFHFSPRNNWTNDPNGLVYFEGEYHLFFQFNPFGEQWGHMSWGHAVSSDLIHWQELPVAIPEGNSVMIFTGSTVVDERNTSGFCTSGKPCLVAVYTGHTPGNASNKPLQTQNLAYSNDRGRTWTKFAGNPVLDLHLSDFRDPKVFWSRQARRWTMVVALPDEHKVRFYGSADLKQWQPLSDFGPAGGTGGQWECPELFELPVNGDTKQTRWILKIGLNPGGLQGGSGEQYFVGEFDGTRFVNANPASLTLWTDYGKDCYCALTFNHLPPGQPQTMLGWMSNWQYAGQLPTGRWRGQMTFPRKLALRNTIDGLRLVQLPVDAIDKLHAALLARVTGSPAEVNARINSSLAMDARNRELSDLTSTFSLGNAREVGWRVLASADSFTAVGYNRQRQELFIDRTHSGQNGFSKYFPARIVALLKLTDPNRLQLRLLIDRSSIEVFAEDGRLAMTSLVFPKPGGRMEVYNSAGKRRASQSKSGRWLRSGSQRSADRAPLDPFWRKLGYWQINLLFFRPRLGYSAVVPQGGSTMTPKDIALSVEVSREYFNRSTRELKEENSIFAPAPGMFTVAALVAHTAQTIDWFFAGAFAEAGFDVDFERMDREVRTCTSLDAVRTWFNAATDRAKAAAEAHSAEEWAVLLPPGPIMGGLPRYAIVSALTDHTAHHRGALTVYTRLLGRVPPMPYMDM